MSTLEKARHTPLWIQSDVDRLAGIVCDLRLEKRRAAAPFFRRTACHKEPTADPQDRRQQRKQLHFVRQVDRETLRGKLLRSACALERYLLPFACLFHEYARDLVMPADVLSLVSALHIIRVRSNGGITVDPNFHITYFD
jgi:hypothetical protein